MRSLLLSLMLLFIAKGTLLAQNCSINAGLSTTICQSDSMKLFGTSSGLFSPNSTSKWTKISGPDATIVNPDSLVTTVIGYTPGTYYFNLKNKCQDGIVSEDNISVVVLPLTRPDAGRDTLLCPGNNYILNANKPISPYETGKWSVISGGGGVTISSLANPNSILMLSASYPGVTKLRWTITNINGCTSYDDMVITNCGGVSPVNAGPDQVLDNCFSTTTCAILVATNGGLGFGNQIGTWSFVSGPSVPVISQINNPVTNVCNLGLGTYIFRYTVKGPCANGTDDVAVTVPAPNQSVTIANANALGTNTSICDGISNITLTGNNPSYIGEVVQWTQTSGPILVHINTPNNPSTTVSGLIVPGTYTFKYNITNTSSGCSKNNEVRYTLFETGTVDGGPDQILPCNVSETTITPKTTGFGYLYYRIISGPAGAFNYPIATPNVIKGMRYPGTYRIEVNYNFGLECPSVNDFVDVIVSHSPTGSNAGTYQSFTCASSSTQLAGNNPVLTGLGSGLWSQVNGPNSALLINPTNFICDVKGTIPGVYTFRWSISGGNNCPDNHDDIVVITPDSSVTSARAGVDRVVCFNSPIYLGGNPFRADEKSKWTVYPSDGVVFSPSNTISSPNVSGLAANKTYVFTYTIMNSCGNLTSDSVRITTSSSSGPSAADAGSNQCQPNGTSIIQLNAIIPASGVGIWSQIEGAQATLTNPALHNTTVTNVSNGTSKFVWTVSVDGCNNNTKDTVVITISNNTTIANSGNDIIKCGNSTVLNGNIPLAGSGRWSQISGNGNAIIDSIKSPIANVRNLITGLYTFRWTITNDACPSSYDDVTINISSPPSTANAGPSQTLCNNTTSTTLAAIAPASGSGQWVWVSGSGSYPKITGSTLPNAAVSNLSTGSNVFRWIVSGGPSCPASSDDIVVNVSVNANAGADKSLCNLTSVLLKGNTGSAGVWSQITGPAANVIQTPVGNPNANISGLLSGTSYTFRYTIPSFSGCPSTYDDVIVNNGSPTLIPDAGADDVYCNATAFGLKGSIPGPGESGTWSILSGQTGTSFSPDANSPNAKLSGVTADIYLLKWTIKNGTCSNSDIKRIDNYSLPTAANAGIDDTLCLVDNILLNANIPLNGIGKWTQISGPNTIVFDAPNNPNSYAKGLKAGNYRFLWTISNHSCSESSDEVSITILNNADAANAGNNQNICTNSVTLSANGPTGTNKGIWTLFSGPNIPTLSSFVTPMINVTKLISGKYRFVWKIYNERCFNADTIDIIVNTPVSVYAGADRATCNQTAGIALSGAAVSGYTNTGSWSIISGEGTLSNTSLTNTPYDVIFYPSANYSGSVVLRLTSNDVCHTVYDELVINVSAPISFIDAINDTTRTDPNTSLIIEVLKNDKIFNGDTLKLCNNAIVVRPANGTAIVNGDGSVSYKPVTNYLGIDSFSYKLCNDTSNQDLTRFGCYTAGNDNAWVYITIEGCILPNSFSPDGDGVNDFFVIPCAQGNVQFNVFNRWGIEVYKSDNYKNDWDGTYNGASLPDGTYFYILKYSSDNINKLTKDGFITLRR